MKNSSKLLLATAIIMLFAFQSNAQDANSAEQPTQKQKVANSASGNFVDKDNNGVCDNLEARQGNGHGKNYVDKNGDGICDNRANFGRKSGNTCKSGQGNQYRHGQGNGRGCGKYCKR